MNILNLNKRIIWVFFSFIACIVSLFLVASVYATNASEVGQDKIKIYLFWGEGCPHCESEKQFLNQYLAENPDVSLTDYEVWGNKANLDLLIKLGERIDTEIRGVPFTLIGDRHTSGYSSSITTAFIKDNVEYYRQNVQPDLVSEANAPSPSPSPLSEPLSEPSVDPTLSNVAADNTQEEDNRVNIPVFGEVNPKEVSLALLAIVIGTIDGFNPCSLWVLLFLISILIGLEDRKKILLYGGTFILVEALSYAAFMVAWLNLMLFVGFIGWVRTGLGMAALIGGLYSLRNFIKSGKNNGGCSVTNEEKREKMMKRVNKVTSERTLWLALAGIAALAFSVNLIELLCSAGLPAVFTQVLGLNNLSSVQYVGYVALYIFFFMIDDLIVFIGALATLRLTGISTKYSQYSHLIGGLIMAVIGLLLVFKPEVLWGGIG